MMVSLAACQGKKKAKVDPVVEKGTDVELYTKAQKFMKKNPEKARLLYKQIMQMYPESIYANKSKLSIGDSYFQEKDPASLVIAASEYQEYVSLFPYSPDAAFAKLQIGMCYYQQMRRPERDQSNSQTALKSFESVISQYPGTTQADTARKKIAEIRQNLAMHYFLIGYYNYRLKAYEGAIARFKSVINEYPEFKKIDRLLYITGLCYFSLTDYDSAVSFFQNLISNHPKSKYIKRAQRMITDCDRQKKKKPAAPGDKK